MSRRWEVAAVVVLLVVAAWVRGRVADGWVYAGSDSYGYLKLADELRVHHRYALGPNEPLHFGRVPGYPIFLALAKGAAPAGMNGGSGGKIKSGQRWLDLLIALPLLFLLARRLGGPKAGLIALGIAAIFPFTVIFTAVALTESVATTLTVADRAAPPRRAPAANLVSGRRRVGGARDPGAARRHSARERVRAGDPPPSTGGAQMARTDPRRRALAFRLSGRLRRLAGAQPDRFRLADLARPAHRSVRQADRSLSGLLELDAHLVRRLGVPRTAPATCFFNRPACPKSGSIRPPRSTTAIALPSRSFAERAREGMSPAVSDGFQKLADARRARHPLRVLVALPVERAWHMWVARRDEVLPPNWRPWRQVTNRIAPYFRTLSFALLLALLLSGALLLRRRDTRAAALVLLVPIVTRSLLCRSSSIRCRVMRSR